MAYVAVDNDGDEGVYKEYPKRFSDGSGWYDEFENWSDLPKGSIEKLIGKKLTWEDEPVELKETKWEQK